MNAHTPGPWTYARRGTVGDWSILGPDFLSGELQTKHVTGIAFNVYHEANAALLASAPHLLAVAKVALDYIHSLPYEPSNATSTRLQDALVDAIAQAEGKA